jgi:hypothetical protein
MSTNPNEETANRTVRSRVGGFARHWLVAVVAHTLAAVVVLVAAHILSLPLCEPR